MPTLIGSRFALPYTVGQDWTLTQKAQTGVWRSSRDNWSGSVTHFHDYILSLDRRLELFAVVCKFVSPDSQRAFPLGDWLSILGWMNWALNAYPLLKPALQPV